MTTRISGNDSPFSSRTNWINPVQTCKDLPPDAPSGVACLVRQCMRSFIKEEVEGWVCFIVSPEFKYSHDPNCPALYLIGQLAWR